MSAFTHLLSPLSIGGLTLPNRIVMGAMHTRLETLDRPQERLAAFYAARARGQAGLLLTGGHSPVPEGAMDDAAPVLNHRDQLPAHRAIVDAVAQAGGRIALQILHAGRYARVPGCVAPSAGKARINPIEPRVLSTDEVQATIRSFATTAALAREAGYAGVEIMGSEGYLINEFTSAITNRREDEYGGSFDARLRFPVEIVRAVREAVGPDFLLIYRISAIDLMPGGMTPEETATLARRVEAAGVDLINTGIGWHESLVPTIAAAVPRAAWIDAVRPVKQAVAIPVMASNRINTPEVAEAILETGAADLVSMARPLLADPDFALKLQQRRSDEINTCIACNQACLDAIFTNRAASCLVNPRAGREVEFSDVRAARALKLAVVGGGPAGMAFAVNAAERGHRVTLFEAQTQLGGQLEMARRIPGKSEFNETLRYHRTMLQRLGVEVHLGRRISAEELAAGGFDEVVLATGAVPRRPEIPGIAHPKVLGYDDVLARGAAVGRRVAIIGAGGIGFDVALFLLGDALDSTEVGRFRRTWGVDPALQGAGGLAHAPSRAPWREVHLLQRKPGSLGRTLGRTTGWILKALLRQAQLQMHAGVRYEAIDDEGLHFADADGQRQCLAVDHVIVCAGQVEDRSLHDALVARGIRVHLIGGADQAAELDAVRAIDQAARLA
ncbi:MAG: FAD-dependent oxidoreductase, partial [Burkholderiales bacterium]|nr:FAD-dependent oxidoreductase [Burkholderiales bacterium]